MAEAIARWVPDGAAAAMGGALESAIPFAAGHEIIRQGRRDLTVIGPISDMLFDLLIGAGCVRKVTAAWGVSYLPTLTGLGSDLLVANPNILATSSPFTGEPLVAVRAIRPDVT